MRPEYGGSERVAKAARAAERLTADRRVQLVYLFGSTADPAVARPRDLDLAILSDPPLSLDELLRTGADLGAATGTVVDLVSLNDAPIVLAQQIVEFGRCLFARDDDVEMEFVTRTRARYWDFKPYRDEQWRLAAERQQERLDGA